MSDGDPVTAGDDDGEWKAEMQRRLDECRLGLEEARRGILLLCQDEVGDVLYGLMSRSLEDNLALLDDDDSTVRSIAMYVAIELWPLSPDYVEKCKNLSFTTRTRMFGAQQ